MAYTFKYRLQSAPAARSDGSGCVDHDIYAIYAVNGEWSVVPGRHKTISVPADVLLAALAQPTNPLKVAAYKDALANHLDNQPVAVIGWTSAQLLALMEANDAASQAASDADTFILAVAGSYPADFAI